MTDVAWLTSVDHRGAKGFGGIIGWLTISISSRRGLTFNFCSMVGGVEQNETLYATHDCRCDYLQCTVHWPCELYIVTFPCGV